MDRSHPRVKRYTFLKEYTHWEEWVDIAYFLGSLDINKCHNARVLLLLDIAEIDVKVRDQIEQIKNCYD